MRGTLIFLFGLLFGAAVAVGGAIAYVLYVPGGQETLRGLAVGGSVSLPSAAEALQTSGTQAPPASSISVPVLRAFATEEYQSSLDASVSAYNELQRAAVTLPQHFARIQQQGASGQLGGLFDLVYDTKSLIDQSLGIADRFKSNVDKLAAANVQTTDTEARQLTQSFITTSNATYLAYKSHLELLNSLLSGTPPTEAQMTEAQQSAANLNSAIASFGEASNALIGYLVQSANEALSGSASSSASQ